MKKRLLPIVAVLLSFLVAVPAIAQRGPDWGEGAGWGHGPGMGHGMMGHRGMMGSQIAPDVPNKLPAPKSQEWTQKLQDVLDLERLSYAQYTTDAEKFNAHMPYNMVIGQEEDHIRTIERLFSAYGLPATSKEMPITETKTITEALKVCVELERDLIPRYEWLVKNAEDRQSAAILNELLLQTRQHMVMFQHALGMGSGGMGPMGGGMGPGMMGNRY